MINKVKYFFQSENYISEYKNTLEEIKQDARLYKKENQFPCFIYKKEENNILDKNGNIIYKSDIETREFDAEEEVN